MDLQGQRVEKGHPKKEQMEGAQRGSRVRLRLSGSTEPTPSDERHSHDLEQPRSAADTGRTVRDGTSSSLVVPTQRAARAITSPQRPMKDQRSLPGCKDPPRLHHRACAGRDYVLNGIQTPTWKMEWEQEQGVKMFLMDLDFQLTEYVHEMRMFKIRRGRHDFK